MGRLLQEILDKLGRLPGAGVPSDQDDLLALDSVNLNMICDNPSPLYNKPLTSCCLCDQMGSSRLAARNSVEEAGPGT